MSVTPDFVGQRYKDTTNGNIWIANSTTPGDWSIELQNLLIEYTPTNVKVSEELFFLDWGGVLTCTDLVFKQEHFMGCDIEYETVLETVSFPNMVDCDLGEVNWGLDFEHNSALETISMPEATDIYTLKIVFCDALTSLSTPKIENVLDDLAITNCAAITSISFPLLVTVSGAFDIETCANLTTIDVSSFVPTPSNFVVASGCALTDTTVNHILARCVANPLFTSGTVNLGGGTSAAPSGQGIIDAGELAGRGVSVTTN